MGAGPKMLGRMFVLRGIAATHVSATQAQSQMDPSVTEFDAFFTNVSMSAFYFYLV
jgi:hypothetical protein